MFKLFSNIIFQVLIVKMIKYDSRGKVQANDGVKVEAVNTTVLFYSLMSFPHRMLKYPT